MRLGAVTRSGPGGPGRGGPLSGRTGPAVRFARLVAGALGLALVAGPAAADRFEQERAAMVREVQAMVEATAFETGRTQLDPRVVAALARVPRHEFVSPRLIRHAYENHPLPIGHGQTISQPYIVALMTDLLGLGPQARVLEIGTGSGYQAAVLAELAGTVFTIEIVEPLAREAEVRLARLGYRNVVTRVGDGYAGWPEEAPFDAILVTAAPDHIPPALIEQLKPGGRLVLPVGETGATQHLLVIDKGMDGSLTERKVLPVRFVPLTREP